jgi:hypothetical protein
MQIEKTAVKNERPGTLPVPALRQPEEGDFAVSIERVAVRNERPGTLPVPALRQPDEGDFEVAATDTRA